MLSKKRADIIDAVKPASLPPSLLRNLPILPLRNAVVFPGGVSPIDAGRASALRLLQDALETGQPVGVITQRDPSVENPAIGDLFQVGTVVRVERLQAGPRGTGAGFLLHGLSRFRLVELVQNAPYLRGQADEMPDDGASAAEDHAPLAALRALALSRIAAQGADVSAAQAMLARIPRLADLADFLASQLPIPTADAQHLLETIDASERARLVSAHLSRMPGKAPPPKDDVAGSRSSVQAAQAPTSSQPQNPARPSPPQQAALFVGMQPLARDAFLRLAAEHGWIFADRSASTQMSPETLTFSAGEALIRYQYQPLLDLSLLEAPGIAAGAALISATGQPFVQAEALVDEIEAHPPAHLDAFMCQLSALFGLHALIPAREDPARLHDAILRLLSHADTEGKFFGSVALSGVFGCKACKELPARGILDSDDARLSHFTDIWTQRHVAQQFQTWQLGIDHGSPAMAAFCIPAAVSHRDLLRALWKAGYVPFQIGAQMIEELPYAVQIWFSPGGNCRVRCETCLETPVPIRLLYAEGVKPERVHADLAAAGCSLLTVDQLVSAAAQLVDGAQVVEALSRIFHIALPQDAARILPALEPMSTHPDPRVLVTLLQALTATEWREAGPLLSALSQSAYTSIAKPAKRLQEELGLSAAKAPAETGKTWPPAAQPATLLFVPGLRREPLLAALSPCRFLRFKPDTEGSHLYEVRLRSLDGRTSLQVILDGVAQGHIVSISGENRDGLVERLRQAGLNPMTHEELQRQGKRRKGAVRTEWLLRERALDRLVVR